MLRTLGQFVALKTSDFMILYQNKIKQQETINLMKISKDIMNQKTYCSLIVKFIQNSLINLEHIKKASNCIFRIRNKQHFINERGDK